MISPIKTASRRSRTRGVFPSPSEIEFTASFASRTPRPFAAGSSESPRCTIRTELDLVANLPAAAYQVFVTGQLLDADGSARVKFVRTDADFRTHAEFSAVGKLCGCIV